MKRALVSAGLAVLAAGALALVLGSAAANVTPPPPNTVERVKVPSFDGVLLDADLDRLDRRFREAIA